MSAADLAKALRKEADNISGVRSDLRSEDLLQPGQAETLALNAELVRVLARIVEGKTFHQAFGAPGDFGYDTPIGSALYRFYSEPKSAGGAA